MSLRKRDTCCNVVETDCEAPAGFNRVRSNVEHEAAHMFTRLCKDPGIETFDMGFPWTGIRRNG